MTTNDKACEGCRWYSVPKPFAFVCSRMSYQYAAASARMNRYYCGPSAKYYEPREKDDA